MTTQTLGQAEGERRKLDALATLEANRELYILRGRRALLAQLLCVGEATADDVRDAVELPEGINPKCFGSVPGLLARANIIRAARFAKTCRPVGHARPVTVWALADRAAAERWLRAHPDRPDPGDENQDDGLQGLLFPIHPTNNPTPTGATAGAGMEA